MSTRAPTTANHRLLFSRNQSHTKYPPPISHNPASTKKKSDLAITIYQAPVTFQIFDFQVEPIYLRFQSRYPFAVFIHLLSNLLNLGTKTLLKAGSIPGEKIDLIHISRLAAITFSNRGATRN
jgi:hypothetical protein